MQSSHIAGKDPVGATSALNSQINLAQFAYILTALVVSARLPLAEPRISTRVIEDFLCGVQTFKLL
jgi:hypothetical protein